MLPTRVPTLLRVMGQDFRSSILLHSSTFVDIPILAARVAECEFKCLSFLTGCIDIAATSKPPIPIDCLKYIAHGEKADSRFDGTP